MIDSERSELLDIIGHIFDDFGGRATKAEVVAAIDLPEHLSDYCMRQGLGSVIGSFFRKVGNSGLPQAPEIDQKGTHAQMELFTVDDCRYLVASYTVRGDANYRRAEKVAEFCEARYGVTIDVAHPFNEQSA